MPSLKVAVALYCCVVPSGSFLLTGVTATDVTVPPFTVIVARPTTGAADDPLAEAMIVVVPGATVTSRPALVTVATAGLFDVQVTVLVEVLGRVVVVRIRWPSESASRSREGSSTGA